MQWLQDPDQSSGDNLKNARREASINFWEKKDGISESKIYELETNRKIKNIRLV